MPLVPLAALLMPHAPRSAGRGPPSMPRADLDTALPTRQEPTCYEMLRLPAVVQSLPRHVFRRKSMCSIKLRLFLSELGWTAILDITLF